jgi:uncharacterized membrane protein YccC
LIRPEIVPEVAPRVLRRLTAARGSPFIADMAEAPHITRTRQIEHVAREERLARALRENLQRRKEQSREQSGARGKRAADLDPARPSVDKAASDKSPA